MNKKQVKRFVMLIVGWTLHLTGTTCASQESKNIQELSIGDICPDLPFDTVINWPQSKARLSDFKGKLVIIDFWANWCKPCISAMPKLDSLQRRFKGEIAVIPVTYQDSAEIADFISRNKLLRQLKLPFCVGDTLLHHYFPHRLLPHEVIINSAGKVIAITSPQELTPEVIEELIKGDNATVSVKKDIIDYDYRKPILFNGGLDSNVMNPQKLLYNSMVTAYIPGLRSSGGGIDVGQETARFSATNAPIETLYQGAFVIKPRPFFLANNPDFYLRFPSRTLWEWEDSTLYLGFKSKAEMDKTPRELKLFCAELVVPKQDSANMSKYLVADLNRFFGSRYGIEGVKEVHKVTCFALVRTTDADVIRSRGGIPEISINRYENSILIRNSRIRDFMFQWLNSSMYRFPTPIIDDTNYEGAIDMVLQANPRNIDSLNKALQPYGLRFELTKRDLEMIIIRKRTDAGF